MQVLSAGPQDAPVAPTISSRTALPTGDGPYHVGYHYENITFSTKNYTTAMKIYYPALTNGSNATTDISDGPYPTIVWLPGTCCGPEHYADILINMASWGLVVVTMGLDNEDYSHSGNRTDVNELLDHLEFENITVTEFFYQMIDKEAFGLAGHSSGGGLALSDAVKLPRIKAVEVLSPAISNSSVEVIANLWQIPFFCQVGADDADYINGCRHAYEKFLSVKSKAEIIHGGHNGPFELSLIVQFFLLYLDKRTDLEPSLYGEQALDNMLAGDYDLSFKTSEKHFFPPALETAEYRDCFHMASPPGYPMDCTIGIDGKLRGYYLPLHPQSSFSWDYEGDGIVDETKKPEADYTRIGSEHQYTEMGNFTIMMRYRFGRLVVTPEVGDLLVNIVNVLPHGWLETVAMVYEDEEVLFHATDVYDTSTDYDSLEIAWDFGDGMFKDYERMDNSTNVSHAYSRAGTYNILLNIRDRHGAVRNDSLKLDVQNLPPSAFVFDDLYGFKDVPLTFRGLGNDTPTDRNFLKYSWDFGDSTITLFSGNPEAKHAYSKVGKYNAVLFVQDPEGEIASAPFIVTINNTAPTGYISSPVGDTEFYEDDTINFESKTEDTMSDQMVGLIYKWNFGDGTVLDWSDSNSSQHAYTAKGIYTVTFQVKDQDGAIANNSINVQIVNKAPVAFIQAPLINLSVIEDERVSFIGEGQDTPSDLANLEMSWDIDGKVYDGGVVSHAFAESGTYKVQFLVTDSDGVMDIRSVVITVDNIQPIVTPMIGPQPVELGNGIYYTGIINDTPTDLKKMYIFWDFGDGITSTNRSGVHVYSKEGTYDIKVKIIDDDGLFDQTTYSVLVIKPYTRPPSTPSTGGGRDAASLIGLLFLIVIAGIALMVTAFMEKRAEDYVPRARPAGKMKKRHTKHKRRTKYPD